MNVHSFLIYLFINLKIYEHPANFLVIFFVNMKTINLSSVILINTPRLRTRSTDEKRVILRLKNF